MSDATLMSAVFIGIVVSFYLMFMRPMQKDHEKHKQQIRDLRPGDSVLTTSGFIATVKDIQVQDNGQTHIALELTDGVIITAVSSAILQRLVETQGQEKKGASA